MKKASIINNIDRIMTPVPFIIDTAPSNLACQLLPYGVDSDLFCDKNVMQQIDVGFTGALHESKHYPVGAFSNPDLRTKIGNELANFPGINVLWNSTDDGPARIPSYDEYAETISRARIWIATKAAFGDVTPRFYEVASTGTLLLCEELDEEYHHIFRDGQNCVYFKSDLSDFKAKLRHYLAVENIDEYSRVCECAKTEMASSHKWDDRVIAIEDFYNGIA
jgi:hypothetical protein